jgi:hypothetical protein
MSRISMLACATFALASPAFAQDDCSGVGADGQWIGGSQAASDITTADTFREQMALVLSGNQHISLFSLSAPTDVRVEAAGRGNGDPAFDLFDANGDIVISDDDSGGNGAARAELSLDAGTYCLSMASYDGAPMTAFVRIGRADQEALTAGVTDTPTGTDTSPTSLAAEGGCADAPMLGTLDGPLTASGSANDMPFWGFSLAAQTPVTITAANETADPTITLRDANDVVLGENDDHSGLNSQLDFIEGLPAGDYCLQVAALDDGSVPIDIGISVYDPQAAITALYDSGEAAPPLDGSVAVTDLGTLSNRMRQDAQVTTNATWYSFAVSEPGLLLIEAIGAGGNVDPWIALYDDLGRQIALNDDAGGGLDSMIAARVTSGGFLLAVKQLDSGQATVRVLMERYVPAP